MQKIIVASLAVLLALGGSAVMAQAREHQGSAKLQLSELPPAVQQVISQESAKHPLQSVALADDDNAKLYEGKFKDGKHQIELKIASDGQIVSREMERNHREDREENDD